MAEDGWFQTEKNLAGRTQITNRQCHIDDRWQLSAAFFWSTSEINENKNHIRILLQTPFFLPKNLRIKLCPSSAMKPLSWQQLQLPWHLSTIDSNKSGHCMLVHVKPLDFSIPGTWHDIHTECQVIAQTTWLLVDHHFLWVDYEIKTDEFTSGTCDQPSPVMDSAPVSRCADGPGCSSLSNSAEPRGIPTQPKRWLGNGGTHKETGKSMVILKQKVFGMFHIGFHYI